MHMEMITKHDVDPRQGLKQQEMLDWNRRQNQAVLVPIITIAVFGILLSAPNYLPSRFIVTLLAICPAVYMTGYLRIHAHSLLNRDGTLTTAFGLIAFLWLVAIGTMGALILGLIE